MTQFKRQQLVQMGFDTQRAAGALVFASGDVACSAAPLRAWADRSGRPEPAPRRNRRRDPPVRALRERLLFLGEFGEMTLQPTLRRRKSVLDRKVDGRRRELDVTLHEGFNASAEATDPAHPRRRPGRGRRGPRRRRGSDRDKVEDLAIARGSDEGHAGTIARRRRGVRSPRGEDRRTSPSSITATKMASRGADDH